MNHYLLLFFGQGLNFLIAVTNIRAAAHGKTWLVGGTDFVFCIVNFVLIQRIAEAGNWTEMLAYAAGGATGSVLAMYITKHWRHDAQ